MGTNLKLKDDQITLLDSIYLLIRQNQPIEADELYTLFDNAYKTLNIDRSSFDAIIDQMCAEEVILKNSATKLFPNPTKFTFQSYRSNYLVTKKGEEENSRFNKLVMIIPIALSLIFGIVSCIVSLYTLKLTKEMNDINSKESFYKLVVDPNIKSVNNIKDTITIQKK
jgi:hypothetical protein